MEELCISIIMRIYDGYVVMWMLGIASIWYEPAHGIYQIRINHVDSHAGNLILDDVLQTELPS